MVRKTGSYFKRLAEDEKKQMEEHFKDALEKRLVELEAEEMGAEAETRKEGKREMKYRSRLLIPRVAQKLIEAAPKDPRKRLVYLGAMKEMFAEQFSKAKKPSKVVGKIYHPASGLVLPLMLDIDKETLHLARKSRAETIGNVISVFNECVDQEIIKAKNELKPKPPAQKPEETAAKKEPRIKFTERDMAEMKSRVDRYVVNSSRVEERIDNLRSDINGLAKGIMEDKNVRSVLKTAFPNKAVSDVLFSPPSEFEHLLMKNKDLYQKVQPLLSKQAELRAQKGVLNAYKEDITRIKKLIEERK
jgi:hypothetical protein